MEKPIPDLSQVWSSCQELVFDRQECYGDHWITEPIGSLKKDVIRKCLGTQRLLESDCKDIKKVKEFLRDNINYSSMYLARIENES